MIEFDATPPPPVRSVTGSLKRGLAQRCPACGEGAVFYKYLKVNDRCPKCGEELFHHRADDAPPYFTIVVVGHVIIGGLLMIEETFSPPTWVQMAIWLPTTLVLSLWLLPRFKGALIGLQWALRMHGFSGEKDPDDIAATDPGTT